MNRVESADGSARKTAGISVCRPVMPMSILPGGIRMNEPAVDLGIVLAMISSYKDCAIPEDVICFGEVGLSGEVRAVNMATADVSQRRKNWDFPPVFFQRYR